MFLQFCHKALAKRITSASVLPIGSKSDPPLPPPIGRPVKTFLKICSNPRNFKILGLQLGGNEVRLYKDQLLELELYAVTTVDLYVTFAVYPRNTEADNALRLSNALQDVFFNVFWMFFKNGLQSIRETLQQLGGILTFVSVAGFYGLESTLDIFFCSCHLLFSIK